MMRTATVSRRSFGGLIALTSGMALLSACGKSSGSAKSANGKISLKLWHGYTEADGKVVQQIIDEFNASQTNYEIKAEAIAWSSINEKLLTSLSSGDGPDIVVQGLDSGPGYIKQGAFIDVEDFYTDTATYPSSQAYYKNVVDEVTWDGKRCAVPMGVSAFGIWYNKKIWEAEGLTDADAPKTVDDLIALAKRLTKGDQQYGIALPDGDAGTLSTILHSGGGDFITDGKAAIDSPTNIETLKTWQKAIVEDKISPTGMDVVAAAQLFQSGKAAMMLNGPWQLVAARDAGVEAGVFAWPGEWVENVAMYWFATSMVDSDEKKAAAYHFMDFWNSHDQQVEWTKTYYPPNRNDIDASEFSDPLVATLAEFSSSAHYYATGITSNVNDITSAATTMMTKIAAGGDVASLVAEAQKQIEGYLAG